jgi:dienelactone hydrolase
MRTFEVVLLLVILSTLFLGFRKQSKVVWSGTAGVNLAVFLLHGIFEGFRYQMAFSYIFVVLFTVFAIIKTRNRFYATKTPKALKLIAISPSLIFLGLTAVVSYALPVFTLPLPTGSYAVGFQYFHLIDDSRKDPFLDQTSQPRELMVKVYYPAQPNAPKPFSNYFHGSPDLARLFASGYRMPEFMFEHLTLVKTHSKEGIPLSDLQPSYPVVLFSHGAGASMETQTSQNEDLASQGYIVVAIDHTYTSTGTVFPNRVVSPREATTNFDEVEPAEVITQIMADDASFVIDQLESLNAGESPSSFEGRFDLENIGAMGHSVGGAVAYNLAIFDDRIKAGINLDGVVYVTPPHGPSTVAPFLMLTNDQFHLQSIQNRKPLMRNLDEVPAEEKDLLISIAGGEEPYRQAYARAQQNLDGLTEVLDAGESLYSIAGCDHMKFTDIGLFIGLPQLREMMGIRGDTTPERCLQITQAVTVAFFEQTLKGETKEPLDSLVSKYPELINVDL